MAGGCAARVAAPEPAPRILAIGDSVLAWHGRRKAAVPDVVARSTGLGVANLAVPGARLSHSSPAAAARGGDIRGQYRPGPWDWVIVSGGANDLLSECGCRRCAANLNAMISADARAGEFPALVRRIRADGPRVVLLGYYDSNALPNVFARCGADVARLNARLARLAANEMGVIYVAAAPVMNPSDQSLWFADRVHPSRLGSLRIGREIARAMLAAG